MKIRPKIRWTSEKMRSFRTVCGGVSSARNYGLDVVTGKYIWFIDSDDFVENNSISLIINKVMNSNSDRVIVGCYRMQGKYLTSEELKLRNIGQLESDTPFVGAFVSKREIIQRNNIRFNINISYAEDNLFMYQFSCRIITTDYIVDIIYFYRKVITGLSSSQNIEKLTYSRIYLALEFRILENQKKNDIGLFGRFIATYHTIMILKEICKMNDKNKKIYRKEIKTRQLLQWRYRTGESMVRKFHEKGKVHYCPVTIKYGCTPIGYYVVWAFTKLNSLCEILKIDRKFC